MVERDDAPNNPVGHTQRHVDVAGARGNGLALDLEGEAGREFHAIDGGGHIVAHRADGVAGVERFQVREFLLLVQNRVGAVVVLNDTYFVEARKHIATQASEKRLPSIMSVNEYAESGGLMSYGAELTENFRRAATYVYKIFKGARAGDLPFELPSRYYLTINMKAAKALGVKIPESLRIRADKVIE